MRPRSLVFPVFLVLFGILSVLTLRGIENVYGTNQFLFFLASIFVFFAVSSVHFFWWKKSRWFWYLGCIFLLILTLVLGTVTNGSVAWLRIGSYRLQPSEFLKPFLLLLLATEPTWQHLVHWKRFVQFSFPPAVALGLVMLQPDLGTTLVTLSGIGVIFLLNRPPKRWITLLAVSGGVISIFAWFFLLQPYQKDRILTFISPQVQDSRGSGYNAQQAFIAVGSGGLWGKGIGNGLQSNLRFLPERQTDFLFATYAEAMGFMGSSLLLMLYIGIFSWIIRLFSLAQGIEYKKFLVSVFTVLLFQTSINIGMNIGVFPITGVTLPLFSLGGSSLLSTAVILGLIESGRRSEGIVVRKLDAFS